MVDSSVPVQVQGLPGAPVSIAAGYAHSLALMADGTVWTWGDDQLGELGDGNAGWGVGTFTGANRSTPVQVLGQGGNGHLAGVTAVAGGNEFSLALLSDGSVLAWGSRLGNFTLAPFDTTPVPVPNLTGVVAIAASTLGRNGMALKGDGTVWTWGDNPYGNLGNGTASNSVFPVEVLSPDGSTPLSNVVTIGAGRGHSLAALADGSVWAWGQNRDLQLGGPSNGSYGSDVNPLPVRVLGTGGTGFFTGATALSGADAASIATRADGTVWGWGYGDYGQIGAGAVTGLYATPTQVLGVGGAGTLSDVLGTASGWGHTIAVRSDGSVVAWGANFDGELGNGTTINSFVPIQVTGLTGIAAPGGPCATTGALPKLQLSTSAPATLGIVKRRYDPALFTINTTVLNTGTGVARGVTASLSVYPPLVLPPSTQPTVTLGDIPPGGSATASWQVTAKPQQQNLNATYTVDLQSLNAPEQAVTGSIALPGIGPIVFVHGINGNAADIRAGADWNALVGPLGQHYDPGQVVVFDYYQDKSFSSNGTCQVPPNYIDTQVGKLYWDPNISISSSICDSKSALALNSALLEDQLQREPQHTAVIANSMGGAITRGWLTLAQQARGSQTPPDSSLSNVDTVIFVQGAQQGAWVDQAGEFVNRYGSVITGPVLIALATQAATYYDFNPNRPGIIDLVPDSAWYRGTNPTPPPASMHYFNFYTDIRITGFRFDFGGGRVWQRTDPNPLTVGDSIMLPGSATPTDHSWLGGAQFLPLAASGYQRQQFKASDPITLTWQNVDSVRMALSIIARPDSHFHYGSEMNDLASDPNYFTVPSCTGGPSLTPTQQIIQILDDPAHACP